MDPELDYTREASSRYQQVYHQLILLPFFHFLNLAAGSGPGPVQEVERSSGCDQCQALEENPDRAEALCPNDFLTARRWVCPVVQEGSRSERE